MNKGFNVYRCKLVREKEVPYVGKINAPDDVFTAAKELGFTEYAEEFLGAFMTDSKGNITAYHEISHGDLNSSIVHPREVFKRAISNNAAAFVLVHNHPSGEITPSEEDISITKRLQKAGDILGIPVLDHLIIGAYSDYYSMKSHDMM